MPVVEPKALLIGRHGVDGAHQGAVCLASLLAFGTLAYMQPSIQTRNVMCDVSFGLKIVIERAEAHHASRARTINDFQRLTKAVHIHIMSHHCSMLLLVRFGVCSTTALARANEATFTSILLMVASAMSSSNDIWRP